ncbi:MAG: acetylglutamate kinase [Candidatus Omnitrophica bacterium]|nr:acetylglutamate kinase [Candidatus Omnitrophota bacterium]
MSNTINKKETIMDEFIKKASVLIEAIPYIHSFRRKLFVIKYGGSILDDVEIRRKVLEDIVFLSYVGIRTILVHGGGPRISSRVKEAGLTPEFHDGIRVTDESTLSIVSEELDRLNKKIVEEITSLKGDVTGLKGSENIIHVEKRKSERDLGFVGRITAIDHDQLQAHLRQGHITVISPMGISVDQQPHNVNADEVASAISASMGAEKLVLLTNVHGVLKEAQDISSLISTLRINEISDLINKDIIHGGMIPKVTACVDALRSGVKKTHIIDARIEHALLLEFFTNRGVGTQIIH